MGFEPLEGLHVSLIYTAAAIHQPPWKTNGMDDAEIQEERQLAWASHRGAVGRRQTERLTAMVKARKQVN